jgi:hypothetical protein
MKIHRFATALTLLACSALAGPPMICHSIEIGGAKSLPWGSGPDWDARLPKYDTTRLVADTLDLLTGQTPVIVRMETLRRAAIYASGNPALTRALAQRLVERTKQTQSDSLASFDAGYFIEAVHQNAPMAKSDPLAGMDGYLLAKNGLQGKDVAAVEYGLALIRGYTAWPNEHYRNAVLGAKEGSLLAANLLRFENKTTLADVRAVVLAKR